MLFVLSLERGIVRLPICIGRRVGDGNGSWKSSSSSKACR